MSETDNQRALARAAQVIRELSARLENAQKRETEPVVIVSTACRFPGGSSTPERFFSLLERGEDATDDAPSARWDVEGLYDPERKRRWSMYTKRGGFLHEDVTAFDAELFGVSPREARAIDPQQRMLLEVAWEALENAGIAVPKLEGSRTGVYVGLLSVDYGRIPMASIHPDDLAYSGTGMEMSFPAGRISYHFGLRGPSMVIASACSASLVAVHQAANALRNQECDLALAGGVNLMLSPEPFIALSKLGAIAPDGRCKTFDDSADGYGRGEGIGLVVLKRLSDALRDGNPILAVVAGSAVNHDGSAGGISVPNGVAQQEVIRKALETASLGTHDVEYVEAHGTGTSLGDPIELDALHKVYGEGRTAPLRVGSVKSNIGHLEGAAGVASVIKLVEALKHETLPRHVGMKTPNSHVDWTRGSLEVLRESSPFRSEPTKRFVGASAFGLSGINAHVLLGDPRTIANLPAHEAARDAEGPELVVLSGHSEQALSALVNRYADALERGELTDVLADVARTTQTGRAHLPYRLHLTVSSLAELEEQLAILRSPTELARRLVKTSEQRPKLAFLCSGQGSQYRTMGKELYESEPVFRDVLDRAAAALSSELPAPLLDVLFSTDEDDARIDDTGFTQPALVALEIALAALWRARGIEPDVVMGHSVGELVAAHLAGVFSLEDVLKLVAARARLMAALPRDGEMWTVFASRADVEKAVSQHAGRVSIAASNGPANVVVSGHSDAVRAVVGRFQALEVRVQQLSVSHAFHSTLMEPMLDAFAKAAHGVRFAPPTLPVISNLTGKIAGPELCTPAYWVRHVRNEVRFAEGIDALRELGVSAFLEIGPRPALIGLAQASVSEGAWVTSLRKGKSERAQMLDGLGALHDLGIEPNFTALHAGRAPRTATLPNYPFQHQSYWIRTLESYSTDAGGAKKGEHPLLGERVISPLRAVQFQNQLDAGRPGFVSHHLVYGAVVLPGAGYLEMAITGARKALSCQEVDVVDVSFHQALELSVDATRVLTVFTPAEDKSYRFEIVSVDPESAADNPSFISHASGIVRAAQRSDAEHVDLSALRARCTKSVDVEQYYAELEKTGVSYGAAFRGIAELLTGDGETLARIACDPSIAGETERMGIHPALLDACFQSVGAGFEGASESDSAYLPVGVGKVRFQRAAGRDFWVHARTSRTEQEITAELTLFAADGTSLATLSEFRFKPVSRAMILRSQQRALRKWMYSVCYESSEAANLDEARLEAKHVLVLGDGDGLETDLVAQLEARGATVHVARPGDAFQRKSRRAFTLKPSTTGDYQKLFAALAEENTSLDHVIALWGVRAAVREADAPRASLERSAELVLLAQTLAARAGTAPRLTVVTRAAIASVGDGRVEQVANASLWGLGKALTLEHPELHTKCIDLPARVSADDALRLVAELLANDAENQVLLRDGQRKVPRLVRDPALLTSGDPIAFAKDGTYLVTGGTGALGVLTARFLGEHGAGCLALVSRRGPASLTNDQRKELEATGSRVVVFEGDVAVEADVVRILSEIADTHPPLRGVIHSAGVLDDGVVLSQNRERFQRVFGPKVDGAMHLHRHTQELPLDHFVLYSSAASVMGRPGQSNYVAANTFLDELAHTRRAMGLPALSINWGAWRWVGLAAERMSSEALAQEGVQEIEPEQGLEVLEMLMRGQAAQAAVMPMDLSAFGALAAIPMFTELVQNADAAPRTESIMPALMAAPARERPLMLRRHVEALVMRVLGLRGEHLPSSTQGFSELGMDSLTSVEVRNRLQEMLERTLPGTLAFDHPNLDALTAFLAAEVLPREGAETETADAGDVLSDDMSSLLDDVLARDDRDLFA